MNRIRESKSINISLTTYSLLKFISKYIFLFFYFFIFKLIGLKLTSRLFMSLFITDVTRRSYVKLFVTSPDSGLRTPEFGSLVIFYENMKIIEIIRLNFILPRSNDFLMIDAYRKLLNRQWIYYLQRLTKYLHFRF